MQKKRRHHYVWRNYLKAWAPDGTIWCCRSGKVFSPGLRDVAVIRDFYRTVELRREEVDFIRRVIIDHSQPSLRDVNNGWINIFGAAFEMRNQLQNQGLLRPEIDKAIDTFIHNAEEELHFRIEKRVIKHLDSILSKDISFYETEQGCIDFAIYICEQYGRTPKMKSNVLSRISGLMKSNALSSANDLQSLDFERIWSVLRHILATNIAGILYAKRGIMRMVLLKSQTAGELITGDQPVINTFSVGLPSGKGPDEFEFYYPVSPKLAILITERSDLERCSELTIGEPEVDRYNRMIVEQSDSQIYAASEATLSRYMVAR